MIAILHGYLLDGSGSNLWTQAIVRNLCRAGETVHLVCQEPHPEQFDFVQAFIRYDAEARPEEVFRREVDYPGGCLLHKPHIGETLPVYVWDSYEEYRRVVPMVQLSDAELEEYVQRNLLPVEHLVSTLDLSALHVNHALLLSVVAQRLHLSRGLRYTVMPHGSALEYAVKVDPRLHALAAEALSHAARIFVHGPELRRRVGERFPERPELVEKIEDLHLGVDTSLFRLVPPEERGASIEGLAAALQEEERGKRPEQTRQMRHRLGDAVGREALQTILAQGADYTAKHPDADCEAKLAGVDWEREKTLLFVGRLIASKGIQAVVAALPAILRRRPEVRLIVVGHGPLREALEALLWALDTGSTTLLHNLVRWGRALEGGAEPEPWTLVARYLARLERRGELDAYLQTARQAHVSDRVIFCGYLTHRQLRFLFPCCDVAVFPSIVAETGPLVFLEALAAGAFPLGIYFAGMGASIDAVAPAVPAEVAELMKLPDDPELTVEQMVEQVCGALALGRGHAEALRRAVVQRNDWSAVAGKLAATLRELSDEVREESRG